MHCQLVFLWYKLPYGLPERLSNSYCIFCFSLFDAITIVFTDLLDTFAACEELLIKVVKQNSIVQNTAVRLVIESLFEDVRISYFCLRSACLFAFTDQNLPSIHHCLIFNK